MQILSNENPMLHRPSKLVSSDILEDNGRQLKSFASLLMSKAEEKLLVGLSACQIGIDLSMFVMFSNGETRFCVNPEIVAATIDMKMDEESSIHYPNLLLKINRPVGIMARYLNVDGKEVTEKLEGSAARIWLHQFDHCNGICIVDRVGKLKLQLAKKKLLKITKRK